MKDFCVCILAHNEQKHIAETIKALSEDCINLNCDIKVYANGCSDQTVQIVNRLIPDIENLELVEIDFASKPNAWNMAYKDNHHSVLVFSDGDIIPERGAVKALWESSCEKRNSEMTLVGCSLWPKKTDVTPIQRIVGFLQIPFWQDFLSGGLYAVNKKKLTSIFQKNEISEIPMGIVAEDAFLELLVSDEQFSILMKKVYYEPPSFKDYLKYQARVRWQNEQLVMYRSLLFKREKNIENVFSRFTKKIAAQNSIRRFLIGMLSCVLRFVVKMIFMRKILGLYLAMGPVGIEGRDILSDASRSRSAK